MLRWPRQYERNEERGGNRKEICGFVDDNNRLARQQPPFVLVYCRWRYQSRACLISLSPATTSESVFLTPRSDVSPPGYE